MGVHGLTPFLRKACPDVLHSLPDRFNGLRGKTLIIDATLITQRFHFVQNKHPHQHIISWYRLAKEFEKNDIRAICVFDGKTRNLAKAREAERRREVRELTMVRASIEQDRYTRLLQMKEAFEKFRFLGSTQRKNIVELLASEPSFTNSNLDELLQERRLLGDRFEDSFPSPPFAPPLSSYILESSTTPVRHGPPASSIVRELAAIFRSLFLNFSANVAKIVTLSSDSVDTELPASPPVLRDINSIPKQDVDRVVERLMSKSQCELTITEGSVWKDCIEGLTSAIPLSSQLDGAEHQWDIDASQGAEARLDSLLERSSTIVSSYERRTNAPTRQTYQESKDILNAMGICTLEVSGAFEAEALASAMVLAGLGDYVISEDTDVLVYDAPMIRNITGRDSFLMVSGATVRESLSLTRNEFVDFCILLGTDFSQRITNVGPIRALKFIRELGSIEKVADLVAEDRRYSLKLPMAAYLAQVDIARSVFNTLPPLPPFSDLIGPEANHPSVERIFKQYGICDQDVDSDSYDTTLPEGALTGNCFGDSPSAM